MVFLKNPQITKLFKGLNIQNTFATREEKVAYNAYKGNP